jgi:hypothetical protein
MSDKLNAKTKEAIIELLDEVMGWHADPDSPDYNECDKPGEACSWCCQAKDTLKELGHE